MKKYKNLYLIGSSHISSQSVQEVEKAFKKLNPSIIALELDKQRADALISKKKRSLRISDINKIGFKGYLFNLIGAWMESKLASSVNIEPGAEMIKALSLARKKKKKIALIDQPVQITLKKISKRITIREKIRFLKEAVSSVFLTTKKLNFDLKKVPEEKIIDQLTKEMKLHYPSLYLTLVIERNEIMAKNLYRIMQDNKRKKILAIVGAGHLKEIIKIIKNEFSKKRA
jgi:pheromone shutdown protein TraB